MREIRTLRATWRELETESQDHRASSRPYRARCCRRFSLTSCAGTATSSCQRTSDIVRDEWKPGAVSRT